MPKSEIVIRLGGEGGEGVISTGDIFALGSARTGYHVFTFRTYPAEIKGGHAWYQARVGNRPVLSIGDAVDVLVAFNTEAYQRHIGSLRPEGVLIYDPNEVTPEANGRITKYPVPFNRIAKQELDFIRGKNVVVSGVLAGLFGLNPASLEGLLRERYRRRAELIDQNLKALDTGYKFANQKLQKADPFYLTETEKIGRLVMSGNEAIVAGSLTAGCRFFAGYPITPATDILEGMAKQLPKIGGVTFQSEDEIAAIGSTLGASYAGVKAMTATSGPGFALMTEFISWSGMAEVPCVIVDAQRSGPSTGMATKLEQSDLNHALFGGHGDFPRVVIAPGSVEDCFFQMVNAFNMAEKYQLPVMVLSDQSLSHRTESLNQPDVSKLKIEDRVTPAAAALGNGGYKRFAMVEDGISPMSIPGQAGGMYVAPGLEHDEQGYVNITTETHVKMMPKRFHKMEAAQKELDAPPRYGVAKADVGVIGWGSTEGAIKEAIDEAVEKGLKVAAMHPKVLSPLPEKALEEFIGSVKKVIVPELNFSGQFARYLRSEFGIQPVRLNKYDSLPFTAGQILRKIEEVANG